MHSFLKISPLLLLVFAFTLTDTVVAKNWNTSSKSTQNNGNNDKEFANGAEHRID